MCQPSAAQPAGTYLPPACVSRSGFKAAPLVCVLPGTVVDVVQCVRPLVCVEVNCLCVTTQFVQRHRQTAVLPLLGPTH